MPESITNFTGQEPSRHGLKCLIVGLVCFGVGVISGTTLKIRSQIVDQNGQLRINKVLDVYTSTHPTSVDFSQYWDVWDTIKKKYANQPVDDVKLFYGSIQGMVGGLGDPYSVYFPPAKAQEFTKDLSGEFEGVGAEIGVKNDQIIIIAPLAKSPAERAGLKAMDKIIAVDGVETFGLSLEEVVKKIQGPKGTKVTLSISRDGLKDTKDYSIVRETINVPSVEWSMKDKKIAYVHISYFNENTGTEFDKIVGEMLAQSPRGIILDMRSNPGGFLDRSVKVASEWIPQGVIVRERFVNNQANEYPTEGRHRLAGIPTVVLVDEGTASGAEIVAGALQDYKVAKIVGKKTFGKGSVQDFQLLKDGSALKLTIAKWYTPNDRQIDKTGIIPDITIDQMFVPEGPTSTPNAQPTKIRDAGLQKALQLLTP